MIENMKERSKKTGITKADKGLTAGIFLGALCLWAGLFFCEALEAGQRLPLMEPYTVCMLLMSHRPLIRESEIFWKSRMDASV